MHFSGKYLTQLQNVAFSPRKNSRNVWLYFDDLRLSFVPSQIDDNIESRLNLRQLQGRPNDPELALTTSGSTITGTADFNQGGQQTIRLFKENCSDKFEDTSVSPTDYAEFVVTSTTPSANSVGSVYSASGNADDDVVFELSMDELYTYLEDNTDVEGGTNGNELDGGIVTVCIQLESVNTIKNFIRDITIDLTHTATIDTTVAQPDANVDALNIETALTAVVCDYNSENAIVAPITVPGMIYVCITCTEGYRIEDGTLTADSAFTGSNPDEAYNDYLDNTNAQTMGTAKTLTDATAPSALSNTWSSTPTSERLADNKVRVSVQGLSSWAATATNAAQTPPSSLLTITVTAQFDPVRRLATVAAFASDEAAEKKRHLRQRDDEIIIYAQDAEDKDEDEDSQYHWGRLRHDGGKAAREKPKLKTSIFAESAMEFAQATTTVLIHGPAPVDDTLSVPIAGVIAGTILLCCSCC